MKPTIFTSLAPNTESDDVRLAARLLLTPWSWQHGSARKDLEAAFRTWLELPYAYAFESGRTALYAILSSLDLKSDDEVLLQAFTCVAVPGPILWAGAKPVYVDVDEKSLTMSPEDLARKITPKSRVLLIQHTFGQAADLSALIALAKKHELFVIEDCAHTIDNVYHEKPLGAHGDAAIFSFGRDKAISSVFGGMAVTKREDIGKRVAIFQRSCPLPSRAWIAQQLFHPLIAMLVKTTYDTLALGKIIFAIAKRLGLLSKTVYPAEKTGGKPPFAFKQFPEALARLAIHQFHKRDRFNEHRMHISKIYQRELDPRISACSFSTGAPPPLLRYPIRAAHPLRLEEAAARERILLGDWYTQPLAPTGVNEERLSYVRGSCPVAETLAAEILNLPTDIHVTSEDALRIIACLHQYALSED